MGHGHEAVRIALVDPGFGMNVSLQPKTETPKLCPKPFRLPWQRTKAHFQHGIPEMSYSKILHPETYLGLLSSTFSTPSKTQCNPYTVPPPIDNPGRQTRRQVISSSTASSLFSGKLLACRSASPHQLHLAADLESLHSTGSSMH